MATLVEQRALASVLETPETRRRRAGCGGLDKLDHRCGSSTGREH